MEFYPLFPKRDSYLLNTVWDFAFTEDFPDAEHVDFDRLSFDGAAAVPGVFDTLPGYCGARGIGFYRKYIDVKKAGTLLLKSGGLGLRGSVFWNREPAAMIDLPYSGTETLLKADRPGPCELILAIDNRFHFEKTPLFSQYYDFYAHGGIYRPLELQHLPEKSIDRVYVTTLDHAKRKIGIKIVLRGNMSDLQSMRLSFDGGPEIIPPALEFETVLKEFALWSPEHPVMHTLKLETEDDSIVEEFGIRTIKAEKGSLLLNGEKLHLHGFCRHESHPQFGPALPLQILLEDIGFLKDMNCNFVRGSHYPQDQRFLSLCDRAGILVWEEGLGWGDKRDHIENPSFRSAQKRQLKQMVRNSFNHPSVIIFGFLNEGDSHETYAAPFYSELIDLLHKLDPARLVTYASARGESDVNFSKADLVAFNTYPAWYAADSEKFRPLEEIPERLNQFLSFVKKADLNEKPVIISEIGAGALYGWHDRFKAPWSEEYQAEYIDAVCRYLSSTPEICGLSLWHFADCRSYTTSKSLFRPRTFNNKGVMDEYRRPKLAYEIVKQYFSRWCGQEKEGTRS